MPEIGEIARVVHYLHKHLVGKTISVVKAQHDENVFGKVGTSAAEFEKAVTGKKVMDARQQGKYFWIVLSSPPHPLMHFGMTGWWKIRDQETAYYKPTTPDEKSWPPKFWKFCLQTTEDPEHEHAFVDSRRFARVRLIDCEAQDIRDVSPLKENGPDPVIDKDILTEQWLVDKLQSKHVPIKALLLDQANISGIGNWVGDELLYDARVHPEQYSDTLSAAQMKQLHKSIHYVCSTAVELLAESEKFPKTWLFKHRWGKGKKDDPQRLPNGEKIQFVTVGGRTSAIVPSVQKKTGKVAADVDGSDAGDDDQEDEKPKATKRKGKKEERVEADLKPTKTTGPKKRALKEEDDPEPEPESEAVNGNEPSTKAPPNKKSRSSKSAPQTNGEAKAVNSSPPPQEENAHTPATKSAPEKKKTSARKQKAARPSSKPKPKSKKEEETSGRRRSARVSGVGA